MSSHSDTFSIKLSYESKNKSYLCKEIETSDGYNKIVNENGEVAVIYCAGGRWNTLCKNPKIKKQLMFDSRIIRYKFNNEYSSHNYDSFMRNIINLNKEDIPYCAGFNHLSVQFLPKNTLFRICEYMDTEFIDILDISKFTCV